MSKRNTGWGIAKGDIINLMTVSPTKRGALVNWLVADAGIFIEADCADEFIDQCFKRSSERFGVRLIRVQCTEIKGNGQ